MDLFYAACDIVVSRAGALTLAELSVQAKPCILIPSPNVAEDHQRKNARAFVETGAALMIEDSDLLNKFWAGIVSLTEDPGKRKQMSERLLNISKPMAAQEIAKYIVDSKAV